MEDIATFDNDFMKDGLALFREMGVPDDIARVYVRAAQLLLMGIDGETAKKLACQLEDATRPAQGSAE